MSKIIDFNEFKTKQEHKNSANVHSIVQLNKILNFDEDLSNDWYDVDDIEWIGENQHSEAKSKFHLIFSWSKLFRAIFTSKIKKS